MSVGQGSSHMFDPEIGATVLNETSVSTDDVMNELAKLGPEWRMVANWQQKTQSRAGGIFQRDRYLTPDSIFDQFRTAKIASETDDVVSGVVEATEALAFNRMTVDVEDADEEDIWNQIVDDLDLDNHMRSIWRELFIVSQCYVGTLWGRRSFKVRGKTRRGIKRKKNFENLVVPIGLTILDPLKVIPVGNFMFGAEKLAYIADKSESEDFDHVLAGENTADLPVQQLISERYIPSESEKKYLKELTGERSLENLYVLNPDKVYRHTATRPSYARFAPCRMKSIFELLDLKQQLRQMDRAHLIGGSNFIVLITMGDKDHYPAQGDLAAMRNQVQVNARVPVIVGDYTLDVKIVTPKLDMTLKAERHNAIDSRITARLYQLASSGNYCLSEDTEILTADGWKTYDKLSVGENVLTLNPATNLSEWQPTAAVNVFKHNGKMLSMETGQHSSLSTPNHRWITELCHGAKREWSLNGFVTSAELSHRHRIPTSVPHVDFPSEQKYSDAFVELVAWYWTEGHINRPYGGPHARRASLTITQSHVVNSDYVSRIRAASYAAFGAPEYAHWRENVQNNGITSFTFNNSIYQEFDVACPEKVPTPSFIRSLTKSQLDLFIDVSVMADGSIEKESNRVRFFQKSQERIDAFEMACALAGRSTSRQLKSDGSGVSVIGLVKKSHVAPHRAIWASRGPSRNSRAKVEWVDYEGIVWCPTTPNGTWLARRNGTVYFTGNSSGYSGDDSIKLSKVIARGLESRRYIMKREIESNILDKAFERNEQFTSKPSIAFHPRTISLNFDPNFANFMFDIYQHGDISRETFLSEFDLSQSEEARKRESEKEQFGKTFTPDEQMTQKGAGRRFGGNNNGGGNVREGYNSQPGRGPADDSPQRAEPPKE